MFKYQAVKERAYVLDNKLLDIKEYIKDRIKSEKLQVRTDWLICVDDIVFNPIFSGIDEIISTFERIKNDYLKSLILLRNIHTGKENTYSHTQSATDYATNKKLFSNSFSKVDIKLKLFVSKLLIDLYSSFTKKLNSPDLKEKYIFINHRMRMIFVIQGIVFKEKEESYQNDKSNHELLSIENINTLFLKNLDYRNSQINLINKVDNITKETSFFKRIGFVEIIYAKKLSINIAKEKQKNIKSEFIVDYFEFSFCKDSFKYLLRFIDKARKDFHFLSNFIVSGMDDKESAITELEMIQERIISENINFPIGNTKDNVSYRKISISSNDSNKPQNEARNTNRIKNRDRDADYWNSFEVNCDRRSYSSNPKLKKRNDEESHSDSKNSRKEAETINLGHDSHEVYIAENYNIFFKSNKFSLFLYDGKDFAFEDKYVTFYESHKEDDNNLHNSDYKMIDGYFDNKQGTEREQVSCRRNRSICRNYNSYLYLNLTGSEVKFFYFKYNLIVI
jgi:hypothetical protein